MIKSLCGFDPLPVVNTKVTMTLRELLDTQLPSGEKSVSPSPQKATRSGLVTYRDIIFDFNCTWYYTGDEQTDFENKVLDHFYFRQIGFETPGRFIFEFQKKLKEIMPYYIQMYHSVELMNAIDDPLENYSMTEESESSGSAESSTTGDNTHKHLDTPQGRIANLDDGYMSNGDKDNSSTTSSAESSASTTLTRHGNIGVTTYAQMLEGYRKTFVNVDMMIIDELDELFLQIF